MSNQRSEYVEQEYIIPDWPVPKHVRAVSTTRAGGVSQKPYAGFNLAAHVGDEADAVATNRALLARSLHLPRAPVWLNQQHGNHIIQAGQPGDLYADGSVTDQANTVCAVLTADCLPVLFCGRDGWHIAAAHAGWRGLAAGVLESTLEAMQCDPSTLLAWLGPAIGPKAFEVGDDVRDCFIDHDTQARTGFIASAADRWLANLYELARQRLYAAGVGEIYGGHWCTFNESDRFFSYRRDGITGRMGTLIWLDEENSSPEFGTMISLN